MKTRRAAIENFLAEKKVAIAGVSRDPKKFGHAVYRDLKEKGFEVFPINPATDVIDGLQCYPSVRELPPGVNRILVLTKKPQTMEVVKEAVEHGIRNIWIQQMSETKETLEYLEDKEVNLVHKQCILMYADPVKSIHRFHRGFNRIFGLLPN